MISSADPLLMTTSLEPLCMVTSSEPLLKITSSEPLHTITSSESFPRTFSLAFSFRTVENKLQGEEVEMKHERKTKKLLEERDEMAISHLLMPIAAQEKNK